MKGNEMNMKREIDDIVNSFIGKEIIYMNFSGEEKRGIVSKIQYDLQLFMEDEDKPIPLGFVKGDLVQWILEFIHWFRDEAEARGGVFSCSVEDDTLVLNIGVWEVKHKIEKSITYRLPFSKIRYTNLTPVQKAREILNNMIA